jgi:DNA-binding response OmpR family regulator
MITEKILVVDDEVTVCNSIQKILTKRGYSVDNSLNANDALSKIKNNKFDLVITDLMMPDTDGMELLQIIKEHYPELEVIVITGYASIDTAVKATKLGASDYLPKPFTPEELTEITRKAIEKRKSNVSKKAKAPAKLKPTQKKDDKIDIDMPFSESEVESHTSKDFISKLTRSDIPQQRKPAKKTEFCNLGNRECRRLVLEGRECADECPIVKKEREKAAKATTKKYVHTTDIIDVDMPFNYSEVERIMGNDYINCMDRSEIPRAGLFGRDSSAKHNVLVVDDEPIVCHSLRKILTKQSCAVEEAFDVDAALLKMKLNKYDLIFLDLKMPKTDGIDLLKSIKKLYPDVPVVMISGYASIKTAVEATKEGACNFIPKPFTPEELKVVTREALAA